VSQSAPARATAWHATVMTLFPELFPGSLGVSLAGEALQQGLWSLDTIDIRNFGLGKHRSVDDTPAGGGAGMVMRADVLGPAIDAAAGAGVNRPLIHMSPRGEPFTQSIARELAAARGAIILAGRFEGIDQRIIERRQVREISIGDYVLSGGEVAAMVVIDAVVRLLPGVVGKADSLVEESFEAGLLEYPHYTRPREWHGLSIPDVLLSGDHAKIAAWRRAEAERITRERRPDLWAQWAKRNE